MGRARAGIVTVAVTGWVLLTEMLLFWAGTEFNKYCSSGMQPRTSEIQTSRARVPSLMVEMMTRSDFLGLMTSRDKSLNLEISIGSLPKRSKHQTGVGGDWIVVLWH